MRQILEVLKKHDAFHAMTPQKAVEILEALGPTFVKIGQLASTRSDMLPKEYCVAFDQLHADVSPMPFFEVLQCIHQAYHKPWEEVFLSIDPHPIGSASIAQVHRGVLLNGEVVALKVRRPGIVEEMHEDMTLMRRILATLELVDTAHTMLYLNLDNLLSELERTTNKELDFTQELNNLIQFHEELAHIEGNTCPLPYPAVSNEAVLVMQYVEGIQVDHVDQLKAQNINVRDLANRITQSYITQVLDYGFFHADPHPGNIFIKEKEIVWIDLGMVGSLSAPQRKLVASMFRAITSHDAYELMHSVVAISKRNGAIDYDVLLEELALLLDKYTSSELSNLNLGDMMDDMMGVLRTQHLVMNPSVTMLVRGVMTLEGVVEALAPELNVLEIVSHHVVEAALKPENVKARALEMASAATESVEAIARLPKQASDTLAMLEQGQVSMKSNIDLTPRVLHLIQAAVSRLSLALISAGLFLGSSVLCTTNMQPQILEVPIIGFLGYVGAFVLAVYVFFHRAK